VAHWGDNLKELILLQALPLMTLLLRLFECVSVFVWKQRAIYQCVYTCVQ